MANATLQAISTSRSLRRLMACSLMLVSCVGLRSLDTTTACPCAPGWKCDLASNVCLPADAAAAPDDPPVPWSSLSHCGDTPWSAYRLIQRRNVAAPLGDPSGIAFDGQGLWLKDQGDTLVRVDAGDFTVDRRFTFDNLAETPGSIAYGLAWDGTSIWISVSGQTRKLVRVNPTTGQIAGTMSSPADGGPSDLEFDGTDLWLSTGTGTVFRRDLESGSTRSSFQPAPQSAGRDHGVAFRPGQLWVGDLFGGMEVHDPATGALIATATDEGGCRLTQDQVGASTFVGGQLVMVTGLGVTFYDVQAVSYPGGGVGLGGLPPL